MAITVKGFVVYELETGTIVNKEETTLINGWFLICDPKTQRQFWIQMTEGHINTIRNADELLILHHQQKPNSCYKEVCNYD